MPERFSLDSYIDVAERITLFKDEYPEGSLTSKWQILELGDRTFVVCEAQAFRTPDDKRPGHGLAWEPFPGPTPYTKESELMNAQTSAWGRAIVAVGIVANRSIASRQEVQARVGEESNGADRFTAPTAPQLKYLRSLITQSRAPKQTLRAMLDTVQAQDVEIADGWTERLGREQVSRLIELFKAGALPDPEAQDIPTDSPEVVPVGDDSDLPFAARPNPMPVEPPADFAISEKPEPAA